MVRYVDVAPEIIRAQNAFSYYQSAPRVQRIENGYVAPLVPRLNFDRADPPSVKWYGGVYDQQGRYCPQSGFRRVFGPVVAGHSELPGLAAQAQFLDEDVLYGGVLINHFGHFMTDGLDRLWGLAADGWVGRVVFHREHNYDLPEYQWRILELLGLSRGQVLFCDQIYRFRAIHVPSPSWIMGVAVYRDHGALFAQARDRLPPVARRWDRLFISRRRMTEFPVIGEAELEDLVRQGGFEILCPEALDLRDQIDVFRGAGLIVGLSASALVNLLWCAPGQAVIHLSRGRTLWPAYRMIDRICGLAPTYVNTAPRDSLPDVENIGPFCVDLDQALAFLRAEGLVPARAALTRRTADLMPAYRREGQLTGAILLERQGRSADALKVIGAVAKADSSLRVRRRLARQAVRAEAWAEAAMAARAWARAAPDEAEAWLVLAQARFVDEAGAEAGRALKIAAAIAPGDDLVWRHAFDYLAPGDVARAHRLIERALACRIDPENITRLVRLLVAAGRTDRAGAVIARLGWRAPSAEALSMLGQALVAQGRMAQARRLVAHGRRLHPNFGEMQALERFLLSLPPNQEAGGNPAPAGS